MELFTSPLPPSKLKCSLAQPSVHKTDALMQRTPMAQLSPLPPLAHRLQHVDSSLSIYRVSRSISLLIPCARFIRQSNRGMCRHRCQRICSFIPCHSPPLKLVSCRIPKLCRECVLAADAGRERQRAQRVSDRDQSACFGSFVAGRTWRRCTSPSFQTRNKLR